MNGKIPNFIIIFFHATVEYWYMKANFLLEICWIEVMVLLSGNDMQKVELSSQDGFSNDFLELIFKMGPFSDS